MPAERPRRTLYGSCTDNICGYCKRHHKAMTPQQVKCKQCLAKECRHFEKHEHKWWELREQKKQLRKDRKQRIEAAYQNAVSKKGGGDHALCTKEIPADIR